MSIPNLTAQQIEGRLTAALATIASSWEAMIQPPSATARPRTSGTGALLDDRDDRDTDMRHLDKLVHARREVTLTLNGWSRVVVQDHDVEHGIPEGHDVPAMARFLSRWAHLMAEHEAATDLLDEIEAVRRVVETWAPPTQHPPHDWHPPRPTMRLGACPLTWQDPTDATDKPCPGTLRGDDEGWVRCDTCGTAAVMGWWEQHLPDAAPLMTLDEVRLYLHRHHGMRLTLRGLRAWVERDHLVRSGDDGQGRAVYDVGAVEAALTRRQRMPHRVG